MTKIELETGGSVWKVLTKPGDKVEAGDTLFILEVMKMEVAYEAPVAGEIAVVHIAEGEVVEEDQLDEALRRPDMRKDRKRVRPGGGMASPRHIDSVSHS